MRSRDQLGVVDEEAGGALVGAAAEELVASVGTRECADEIEVEGAAGEGDGFGAAGAMLEAEGDVEGGIAGVEIDEEGVEATDFEGAGGGGEGVGPGAWRDDEVAYAAVGVGVAERRFARGKAEADGCAALDDGKAADGDGVIAEASENNNTTARRITISAPPAP